MIRVVLLALAAISLAGCAYLQDVYADNSGYESGADPYEKIRFAGEVATLAERARCEAAGGVVMRDGMLAWEQCVQTFPDAGKVCRDSTDCVGECRLEGAFDLGEATTGTCQATDSPFGCYARVEDGYPTPVICVD